MEDNKKKFSGRRNHHEQYTALTRIGYSRAMRRKQIKKTNKPIIKE